MIRPIASRIVAVVGVLAASIALAVISGQSAEAADCSTVVKTSLYGLDVVKSCKTNDDGSTPPPSRTLVCGEKASKADAPLVRVCGGGGGPDQIAACLRTVNGTPATAAPFATAPIVNAKRGTLGKAQRWCPGDVVPALALGAIRAEAIRLLPHVRIGSAWKDTALVNAEVILWAATATSRDLPTARVLGTGVRLRIGDPTFHWNFGDDHTDNPTDPGKPYDSSHDPCRTAQCPHYYGHTYTRTGPMTITLTIDWNAQFSLDNGATWTDLDPAIPGPTDRHVITLKQARAILVPNPGN